MVFVVNNVEIEYGAVAIRQLSNELMYRFGRNVFGIDVVIVCDINIGRVDINKVVLLIATDKLQCLI